jgi:hypothetical protein
MIKKNIKNIYKRLLRTKKLRGGTTIFLTAFSLLLVNWKVRFIPEFASYTINCFSGNFQKGGRIQITKSQIIKF